MVAPIVPILIKLASLAPSLMKYFGAGDSATKIAEQAVGIAQTVSGAKSPEEAIQILNTNSEKAMEFRLKIQESERLWDEMFLKDIQSARDRDVKLAQAGYRNYRAHTMYILAVAVIIILTVIIWKDPTINEYVKGIFTLVLGRFLGYLDAIYNFEFGTTRQSRAKDDVIQSLTKNGNGRNP